MKAMRLPLGEGRRMYDSKGKHISKNAKGCFLEQEQPFASFKKDILSPNRSLPRENL